MAVPGAGFPPLNLDLTTSSTAASGAASETTFGDSSVNVAAPVNNLVYVGIALVALAAIVVIWKVVKK